MAEAALRGLKSALPVMLSESRHARAAVALSAVDRWQTRRRFARARRRKR